MLPGHARKGNRTCRAASSDNKMCSIVWEASQVYAQYNRRNARPPPALQEKAKVAGQRGVTENGRPALPAHSCIQPDSKALPGQTK
eukprot:scaffold144328_cov16-Tisochrysis_lutea.AAC.1